MFVDSSRILAALVTVLFITSCSAPRTRTEPVAGTPAESAQNPQGQEPKAQEPSGAPQDLAAQRQQFLVGEYVKQAEQLRLQGKLEEARLTLLQARDMAPTNEDVRRLLSSVNAELGIQAGGIETYAEQQARMQQIQEERARAEAAGRIDTAKKHMAAKNYVEAVRELRTVLLNIEIGRLVDWGGLDAQARQLLAEAEKARDEQEREERTAAERDTLRMLQAEEQAARARRQERVEGLLATATQMFEKKQFKLSQELAYEAMQVDPNNHLARNLHNAATKAVRETRTDTYYREKAREIANLRESNEQLRIPQTDVIRIDDASWQRASARSRMRITDAVESPEDTALRERVRKESVGKFSFTEETGDYREVKKLIQTLTDIPIIITPEAQQVITDESLVLRMELVAPITVANLLDQMTSRSANLAWTVRNGVVEITTKAKAGGKNVIHNHDIRDLVFPMANFVPPVIRDIPISDQQGKRTGGEADEKLQYVEPEALMSNIKDATDPAYWASAEGGGVIDYLEGGYLLVNANPQMQHRVEQFLDEMRRFTTAVVTIESKFLTVSQNFLQQVGVDFRGLGGAGAKGALAQLDDITNQLDDNASRGLDNSGTGDPAGSPFAGAFYNDGQDGDVRARTENFPAHWDPKLRIPRGQVVAAASIVSPKY